MSPFRFARIVPLIALFALSLVGCNQPDRPPMGKVSGKVTMDGQPLTGVIISFMPDSGRAATATTDKDGRYELQYTQGEFGCKVGPNTVTFAVPTGGSPSHSIPPKYQGKTDLKREVKDGRQEFDFALTSDGADTSPPKNVD